ncbi:MAG: ferredoxin-thioredoxin reductase catalytic domain-containing protein, partial [Steroidobacteraceae bacterium]
METESRKKALQYFFDKIVAPLGFKFTPDVELKDFLLEQEVMLERKHGIPFCPC